MPIQDRSRTRARGRTTLLTFTLAASACTLEIPEGWLPEIPTLPDTDTGADDPGEDDEGHTPTTGGEAPEPDTDSTCGGDPHAGSSSDSTDPDTGDATRGATGGESTGTDTGSETTGDVPTGGTTDGESTGTDAGSDEAGDVTTGSGSSSTGGMCGDAVVDADEVCDDGVNDGAYGGCAGCQALGPMCGDGIVNGPEACDGGTLAGGDCTTACQLPTCGDGIVQADEQCEGDAVDTKGCLALGFDGGVLACVAATCRFDPSRCTGCGNGVVEADEACDGTDLAGVDCAALGFTAGALTCAPRCDGFDTSQCVG